MSQIDQVARRLGHRFRVVKAHAGRPGRLVGHHHVHTGRCALLQVLQQFGPLAESALCKGILAARDQIHSLTHFGVDVVVAGRNQQLIATADLRATVNALDRGLFGDLSWLEQWPRAKGAAALADLDQGRSAAAKIVLVP